MGGVLCRSIIGYCSQLRSRALRWRLQEAGLPDRTGYSCNRSSHRVGPAEPYHHSELR